MTDALLKRIGSYQTVDFEKNVMTIGDTNVEFYDLSRSIDL